MPLIRGIAFAAVLVAFVGGLAFWQFGSLKNARLFVRGYNFAVDPTMIDVGSGVRGEKRSGSVYVRNLGFGTLRIVGTITTCSCLTTSDLPMTIQPRETKELQLSVYLGSIDGNVEQMAQLMLDDNGRLYEVPVIVTGKCTQPDSSEADP